MLESGLASVSETEKEGTDDYSKSKDTRMRMRDERSPKHSMVQGEVESSGTRPTKRCLKRSPRIRLPATNV